MPRYLAKDVYAFLVEHGCTYEGDTTPHGIGFYAPDGMEFSFPKPIDGYLDAEIVDRILSDRWIWTGPTRLVRYPD